MTKELSPDIREWLKLRMIDGMFRSEGDVLRAAMDALDQVEEDKLTRWSECNRRAIEQSRQGLSKPLDDEAVLVRMRERLAKEGIVD